MTLIWGSRRTPARCAEDAAEAGERVHAFLYPRAPSVVETDDGDAGGLGEVDRLVDLAANISPSEPPKIVRRVRRPRRCARRRCPSR